MSKIRPMLCALCAFAGAARAQPIAVFVGQTINVREEDAAAFAAVCARDYARASGREAVPTARAQAALKQAGEIVAAAKSVGAGEYLSFELIALSGEDGTANILVNAIRGDASGAILHRDEISMASLMDTPAACDRIVRAALGGTSVESTRDRHNVTAGESRAEGSPVRLKSAKVIGFKLGFGGAVASGASYSPLGLVQFNMLFERERYFLELGGGFLIPAPLPGNTASSYGGLAGELGASYYLTDADNAPYVGVGLAPRIIFSGSVVNVAPYVQAGMMLWRQSSPRIYVSLRVAQNLLPVASTGVGALSGSGASQFPTEISGQVAMGF